VEKIGSDHIWAILIAFLSALGCFTALALVGADGSRTLEVIVSSLGGAIGGYAYGTKKANNVSPS
jgi:hypothetical protein